MNKKLINSVVTLILLLNLNTMTVSSSEKDITGNTPKDTSEFLFKKFQSGINFYATGNEPNWSLDLSINKFLKFNTMDGMKVELGNVKGIRAMDANVIRYASPFEGGFFSVTISEAVCEDNMSGEKFDYTVRVEINNPGDKNYKEFRGCGRYVPDYNLNKKWILKILSDTVVKSEDYSKGLPELEFDAEAGRFSGNAGCNRVLGSFKSSYGSIKFTNPVTTLMMCPDMDREMNFIKALESTTEYVIDNNELKFSNPDKTLMIFYDAESGMNKAEDMTEDANRIYRLNDIWVLETLDGVTADKNNFSKAIPQIEINLSEKKLSGTGGCNRIFGTIEVSGDKIKFGPVASTRMYCEGVNESGFVNGLQNADSWKIENNRLYLMKDDKEIMVLRKVD